MNKSLNKIVEARLDKGESIWPPPPDDSSLQPTEQESEEEYQKPLLTKFAWLDAFVGLVLGPTLLLALFIIITGIGMYLTPPPRSAAFGYTACMVAAVLCASTVWMAGRRFSLVGTTAAVSASILLLFLLIVVWFGSGMMTDNVPR